ncbi:MAG: thymidylate synthase [Thermoguttaceae bacterium]
MIKTFEATSANELWQQLASEFQRGERTEIQNSRLGRMHELMHVALTINDPRQRWVVSREPAINPAFSIAEVVWIVNGRNDSSFLNYFNSSLPKFAGHTPCYHGAYGHRLRSHFGLDQLERVYHALRSDPDSRQAVLQIWDPASDLPDEYGKPASEDIPCNVSGFPKIRHGSLHWMQVMRSNDLFRGSPYNFVQFTTLQEILAGWLGLEVGSYNLIVDSLHVYEDSLKHVVNFCPVEQVDNTDSLALPRSESEAAFSELASRTEELQRARRADQLVDLVATSSLPGAFRNMLCVMAAEGARRRRSLDAASEIMATCTNPLYCQLCQRWFERLNFFVQSRETVPA